MAKKKKFGAILEKQTKQIPVVKQKAPKTISTNVSTGGMRSAVSSTTQSVAKSARQKAEEERSARMRQGLSSVVRSSFNRQMSRPTYINKNTVNRLNQLNKTVTNPLAPIKQKQVTGGNGVGGQRLFSKERSLLNNTKFVTGGQGVGGKTVVNSPIGRAKSSILAPIKEDIQNNPYDAVRKVGMKGSRNERRVYVPMSQRDENGQISTNQRRLENAARGGNRKAGVEAALARTKAQTLSGHTYDQYVNAELNKRGLLGQDYILRGKDPSKEAIDYRQRYGFDKEAYEAIKAIADNAPSGGDYTDRFNGQNNGSAIDRLKFGFDESWRARNIEDTYERQYGKPIDEDTQAQLDAVRDSGGYMVGNMLGQASQFAMTAPLSPLVEQGLMARMGLKGGRAAIKTTKDAVKYAIARIGADQVVSAPVNMIDALKGEDTKDVALRFFYNTGLDVLFGGLLEIPSLRTNAKFVKAIRANDAANAMEEGAEQVAAKVAAEKQLSEAISSFNPVEQRAIRDRMRQLAEEADIQRDINRGFAGDTSASNLDIYNEELPSELSRNEARRLVDTEPTPNELVRERAGNFRNNSEMLFQDGGIASREAVNASISHGVQDSDYLTWRMAYDAARRNGMVEDDAIRYADDYIVSSAERARLVNREPVDTLAVANEEARRADSLLNAANGRETRDSLLDAANNRESSDALLDAANRRRANEPTILSSGEAPRSNGTFGRDVTAKYNESLEADKNLEQAIANYDKPLTELSDAESELWDDTYGEAYRRYSEYPDARQRAMQEADDAVKQKRNIELAQAATRADEAQRAINDLHRTPRETVAEEPTVPREEPVTRTEPNRKKVEEPKQTQTPNNNGEVDGSAVYNTNGGINNGAEQKPRSTAKRTVRKVQEQPDSVADAKIGGRRPEERLEGDSGNNRRLLLDDEQEKLFNDNNVARTGIKESDSPSFISNITENSGSQKYGACVDIPTEKHLKETNAKLYSTADGSGTVAVTKDGDIIALSKKRGAQAGTSDELLLTAIAKGGKKMDAFGADLANLYSRYGFEPVGRVEFNPAIYADEPEKLAVFKQLAVDGKEGPDVYVFKHNGDNLETVIKKNRNGEYKSWSQEELDKLPVFEDSVDSASKETIYGYDKALEYRDRLLREQENPKVGAEKSDKEKLFYNAPKPYTPKGGGKDEKAWKAIRKSYEKNSKEQLELKKQQIKKAVSTGQMPKSQGDERIKLIDNILEQREYYRFGTKKEFNGKKISQTVDTGRAAENIPDAVKAQIEDNVVAGEAGIKMGQNPKAALRDAKTRVKEDPEAIRIKIDKATPAAREGRLPTGYDNLQEYYAEANALLDHYSEKISDLESKGLTDSDEYKKMIDDTANFVEGVFSTRSQEGYAAVQYNMMVRSNAEVRVAVVERSLRQIEEEYANELEKVAKKNGTPISKDDQIHITLSKESRKRLREIDPDNPLEMAITLHKISVETWNQVPADKHEVADAIRKTSMLLNPKTHLRNVIGNTLMIPARIMKDLLGAPIEKWAIRKGYMRADQATKAFVNRFSRSDKPYYDVARAVWKEWKDVIRGDAKMFDSVPTSASKLIGKRPIGEGRVLTAGIENPKTWRKAVDWIIKKNGSALEASDALMMRIHFTDSFAQVCKARNLDPSKLTKEQLMDVIDAATGEAQRATFRDASEVAKTINGWKVYKKNDNFVKKVGRFSVNTTMPFVNTPINILRRSWDYSPAGLIHGGGEILQGIQKHNAKQVKKGIDRMCSGLTGSGVCLLGFYLGKNGNLTARLSEGSEGYYEQDQGFQEYSLNIGGEDGWSVSLSQFAPHTIPLFMGVELANMFDPNEEVNWKALPDVIGRVFDPTMDMSVMQGPMSVLKSISESDSLGDVPLVAAMTLGTNYISQYIPTLSGQIARTIDPVRRDTSSTQEDKTVKYLEKSWNKTLAKIPYASKTLEPYLDSWGNEQVSIDGNPMQRFLYEVASPSYIRKKNITALDKEITRLNGIAADDEDKIIPKKFFGNTVSFDGGDVQISKSDLTTYNKVRGKAAYEAASELIETDAYKNASDAEKRKMIDKVFKDANTKGKQETLLKKGYSASKVYTEGFDGGKKENADKVFSAGVAPKRYYELMTDKSVDLDGNGSKTQYEVYTYLQNTDLTDAQKAAIWNSYNKGWKNNPYAGGTIPTADDSKSGSKSGSNGSKRGRSGRRYSGGGGSSKTKARAKTASEKKFAALQTGKAPTNAKGIEALSNGAKGLTKAQKKALVKLMQKKLDV